MQLILNNIKFDSAEEVYFAMWLNELEKAGYVDKWVKVVTPIKLTKGLKIPYKKVTQLKTKVKIEDKEKSILNPSEYTPDFRVAFTEKGHDLFCSWLTIADFNPNALFFTNNDGIQQKNVPVYVFEIKPSFDQNNMERLFRNNQKFLWDKYEIFVNLVEPISLFEKTFLPLEAEKYFRYRVVNKKALAKGKKVGDFKMDWTPKTLKQYVESIKKTLE